MSFPSSMGASMELQLVCLLLLAVPQDSAGPAAVRLAIAAALPEAAKSDPRVVLAPRVFVDTESFRKAALGTGSQWARVALGAGSRGIARASDEVLKCTASRTRCSMPNSTVLVSATSVALAAAAGTVGVRLEWLGPRRGLASIEQIEQADFLVTLASVGDQWRVVAIRRISIT